MKKFIKLLSFTLLLSSSQVFAQTAKPSVDSIKEIFALTHSSAMLSNVQSQAESMVKNMVQQSVKDKKLTEEQEKVIDKFQTKVWAIQKEELKWEKMEPVLIEIYGNALTQEDVDGMIKFYKSPAGQSFITKMPILMQHSMVAMQKMMGPMMEKVKVASQEFAEDMKKAEARKTEKTPAKQ